MVVRQKPNPSGSISVQVIDKSNGYRVVQTIGTAFDPVEVARLVELGRLFIPRRSGQYSFFPESQHDHAVILDFVETLGNAPPSIRPKMWVFDSCKAPRVRVGSFSALKRPKIPVRN